MYCYEAEQQKSRSPIYGASIRLRAAQKKTLNLSCICADNFNFPFRTEKVKVILFFLKRPFLLLGSDTPNQHQRTSDDNVVSNHLYLSQKAALEPTSQSTAN